jgi:hypothetical protein
MGYEAWPGTDLGHPEAIHRYVDDWVTSITDVTDTAVH